MPANTALIQQLLDALDALSGLHPGFRPVHAKGLMCSGTFAPSSEAAQLTRAPHANRPSTPVTVRYSNAPGVPTSRDNDLQSGPRGIAVRFHLADHVHTDIVAHSLDGFPARTGEEFLEFLHAAAAFGAGKPEVFGSFLATHPQAERFVEGPKPIPTSFAREAFFAVTSFKFTNSQGLSRHGRFRIRPVEGTEYLSAEAADAKPENFLFEEIGPRLARGPFQLGVVVQMAGPGDDVTDASVTWPDGRQEIPSARSQCRPAWTTRRRSGARSSSTRSHGSTASIRPATRSPKFGATSTSSAADGGEKPLGYRTCSSRAPIT
jgi:catalase